MGYFLWLNDRIDTTNAAKVIAIINASNTDTGTTPFRTGVSQPPLSYLFYYSFIVPYVCSVFVISKSLKPLITWLNDHFI